MTRAPLWVVFSKEVRDNLRDRRALASALLYPLLGPVLLILVFSVVERQFSEQVDGPLPLPVSGAEHAPDLMRFLEQHGAEIETSPDDPEAAVRAGDAAVVLVIPDDYGDVVSRGRPAAVQLVVDASRQTDDVTVSRARRLIDAYGQQLAALRLMARGVSPAVVTPLVIETVDLSTPQSQAARFLNLMPYFLIFSVFIGGMYLAIDSTAGERERGSLEALLMNPIRRRDLVLGKLCAVLVFTLIAVAETLVAFGLVLRLSSLEQLVGTTFSLSPQAFLATFLITLPMLPLAAALQIIIASFTRSFKEAQNYLSLLPLIPALPGMFLAFVPVKPSPWLMLIPTFGQQLLINQVMRGETVDPRLVIVCTVSTLVVAAILIAVAIRLYKSERILFGR